MGRAFILLMDSFGVGAAPDADKFGDAGANTFLHIIEACKQGKADLPGKRFGKLQLPNLARLGLYAGMRQGIGVDLSDYSDVVPIAQYGVASEMSFGKDTPSGHWEIAGVPVLFDWGFFPPNYPSFPQALVDDFVRLAKVPGILGNCHSSGTEIIKKLGDEHCKTGKPICYTSADSVFQIACHEETFGLERLYQICKTAYKLVKPYNIARVIARPFIGKSGNYERTEHRRDYAIPPPAETLLDKLIGAGGFTIAVGKIADIFGHHGISKHIDAHGHAEIFQAVCDAACTASDKSLTFANFVDFDMKFGHRRDIAGYATALEEFDHKLPQFLHLLRPDDIVVITADHGCDPTFKGSDHTRECIPVIIYGAKIQPGFIGKRATFADIGQTLAQFFNLPKFKYGTVIAA